jgi:hypothetical protein
VNLQEKSRQKRQTGHYAIAGKGIPSERDPDVVIVSWYRVANLTSPAIHSTLFFSSSVAASK